MCGILGWIGHGEEVRERGERALSLLSHRGPDSGGLVIRDERRLGIGSRRLSILDLREEASQPMRRGTGLLAHNGEIYNFVELRAELERSGARFTTTSDTEVMLASHQRWGPRMVERFNGMFAFALWDERDQTLTLARDRFGEKPLFYASGSSCFHFASEIKALLVFDCLRRELNERVLYRFLATGAVPDGTGETFFAGIEQLPPATVLRVDARGATLERTRYWQLEPDPEASGLSLTDAADALEALLEDSVRIRLRSDVPVGTSLSGGIDSSLVAMLVARLLRRQEPRGSGLQRTFSARHRSASADEGHYIERVVARTEARGREVWIEGERLPEEIDRLVWHQDEPFPHTSMYAQWKVYELARSEGVTVVLDGQGADEVFGGYHALAFGALWAGMLARLDLPALAREIAGYRQLHATGGSTILRYLAARTIPRGWRGRARVLGWRSNGLVARSSMPYDEYDRECSACPRFRDPLRDALCEALLCTSLPSLLRFADRSSMAHSVEVRLPFLDHRVVAFAFGLPAAHLVGDGWTKRVLREILRPELPDIAQRRDKLGFATPEKEWFGGPLRGWMSELLSAAARREIYAREEVMKMWGGVQNGRVPSQVAWRVAIVEVWMRRYLDAAQPLPPASELVRA